MLTSRFRPHHVPLFIGKYAWLVARRRPVLVHFEVTLRCNARCGFCDYWKTHPNAREHELQSFADAARYFNPLMVTFTGGEPLLRRDLEAVVRAVSDAVGLTYVTLITHGAMLTAERARALWDAGVHQFNISLDYLDERHDRARGIPGLADRIFRTVPDLQAAGIDNIRFNTVIKHDNLDQILPLVHRARALGVGVNLSVYTDAKNGNREPLLGDADLRQLDDLVAELLAFKKAHRGVITSSDYYLRQIPRYVRGGLTEPCRSGIRTIHIDPVGRVKRCPDFPTDFHWRDYARYRPINCDACYYACRGEAQAPLEWSRVQDVMGSTRVEGPA
ncbi:MAG: radical SAM protein [Gemmatimonadota bacterium]|nr:radical SAM protein [Gemmatimonadota bacterium]MDE3171995.1 radical SAM protein [Gemmatimonadota bacterium]MDE3216763.1 radical SAM protein [Gemmatimonadota bacterium]